METMTADDLRTQRRPLRRAVQSGKVVEVTFHGKPYAYVVPADQYENLCRNNETETADEGVTSAA